MPYFDGVVPLNQGFQLIYVLGFIYLILLINFITKFSNKENHTSTLEILSSTITNLLILFISCFFFFFLVWRFWRSGNEVTFPMRKGTHRIVGLWHWPPLSLSLSQLLLLLDSSISPVYITNTCFFQYWKLII